ncbi:cupin domain-containing protein [Candidatus Kapabacteria bacterium]|nr:cupin domain-containing protein [Candidatus Kapabacteria bacterium]
MNKINISEKFDHVLEYWSPKIIGELNGQQVKLAKFLGEFPRHKHDNEDELFMVISGKMEIEFDDRTETIAKGEMIIVPKGVYHRPIAESECLCLLFEPSTTINTGGEQNKLTKNNLEWI